MTLVESLAANSQLHWSDYVVLIVYFVIVIAVGIWSSCLNRGSVGGYFLAGRNMNWILVGASLFASNIGSGHFIGLAGSGASSGIGIGSFEIMAVYALLMLGWIFVPVYITSGVYTMPEYLKKRFGGERIRVYLAVLALILYVFTKISADLYAGAVFMKQSMGWDIWGSVIALLVLAMIFTVAGGLSAVIWTDFVQVVIMVIGAVVLMAICFARIGGYAGLEEKFLGQDAWPNISREYVQLMSSGRNVTEYQLRYAKCGMTPENSFHLFRSADDPNLPWPGVVLGIFIIGVWYWCTDQVIVQRSLAAKNLSHAKSGSVLAGTLKLLPMFIMVMPGMISRILYPELVGCADPDSCMEVCGNPAGCTNIAYPLLVVKLMPNGARGLLLAVMMSALMSSLTSIFNSSSTIFTMDIWRRVRSNATEMELMIVGRVFVIATVAVSIAWIPVIQNIAELFHYIQSIQSFLSPPICAVYLLAVLWKRINEKGAFWGLILGLVVGLIRFIWEYSYGPAPPCGDEDHRHYLIANLHYMHFGVMLFGLVGLVTVTISLLTKPIAEEYLRRLTYSSRFEVGERLDIDDADNSNTKFVDAPEIPLNQLEGTTEPNGGSDQSGSTSACVMAVDSAVDDEKAKYTSPDVETETQSIDNIPLYKKALYWICGVESLYKADDTRQAPEMDMSIDESSAWSKANNISAVMLLIVLGFVCGYYAYLINKTLMSKLLLY